MDLGGVVQRWWAEMEPSSPTPSEDHRIARAWRAEISARQHAAKLEDAATMQLNMDNELQVREYIMNTFPKGVFEK